jgi:hypothetical protein
MSAKFISRQPESAKVHGMVRAFDMATLAGQAALNVGLVWLMLAPAMVGGAWAAVLTPPKKPPNG